MLRQLQRYGKIHFLSDLFLTFDMALLIIETRIRIKRRLNLDQRKQSHYNVIVLTI